MIKTMFQQSLPSKHHTSTQCCPILAQRLRRRRPNIVLTLSRRVVFAWERSATISCLLGTISESSQSRAQHFDRRLSFKDHMKDLMTKVYRRLNLLKLLKGTNWGARPYTILKAYKCFIRPVLEYGSLITGALRESQVKEMQIFQNKCLRLALGVTYLDRMRTIDLHDLTNVPMIKTRMTALAVKTFRSLENTQCFEDLVLNHEIVQKRSGSNTILDQLLAAIQADA